MFAKLSIVGLLLAASFPVLSNGEHRGYVTADGHINDYPIDLDKSDIKNHAGFVTNSGNPKHEWDLGGDYHGHIDCTDSWREWASGAPDFYKADMNGLPPSKNGFVHLNEFLDMKVEIWIAGNVNQFVPAPFTDVSNGLHDGCDPRESYTYSSGSRGRVTFKVRKPIINGIQINDLNIIRIFGRHGGRLNDYSSIPMSTVTIKSMLLIVPENCAINNGEPITVEFGDIPGVGLDGNKYKKEKRLDFACEGDEFIHRQSDRVKLALSGRTVSINNTQYLQATTGGYGSGAVIKDFGIKFSQLDGRPLSLNKFYSLPFQSIDVDKTLGTERRRGEWGFIAAPVSRDGAEIPTGDFNATATIVAAFN